MAVHSPNTPSGVAATGLPTPPTRLPSRMTFEEEFLALMEHRDRINTRLGDLVAIIAPERAMLPKSHLALVASAPGGILFKGGSRS